MGNNYRQLVIQVLSFLGQPLRTVLAVKGSLRRAPLRAPLTAPGRSKNLLSKKESSNWKNQGNSNNKSNHVQSSP